jgi:tetratricopeptide (TPR) repeat protein
MEDVRKRSMDIQHQIRHNAEIMGSEMGDLRDWEKTIKKRDKKIRKVSVRGTAGGKPAVRGGGTVSLKMSKPAAAPAKKEKKEKKEKKKKEKKGPVAGGFLNKGKEETTAAKHTHDKGYDKWAKFDVAAAEREFDEAEKEEPEESDSSSSDEDDGPAMHPFLRKSPASALQGLRRPKRGTVASAGAAAPSRSREEVEREDGNLHYKKGYFGEAVKCYTRCIAINPRNVMALSNRAMAYLKLKEWKKAVQDCDLALRVDGSHVKSFTRRATAFNGLGMHAAALDNFCTAASLGDSKQTTADIRKTREMVKSAIRRTPRTSVQVRLLAPGENARVQMQGPAGPGMVAAAEKAYAAQAAEVKSKAEEEKAKAEKKAENKAKAKKKAVPGGFLDKKISKEASRESSIEELEKKGQGSGVIEELEITTAELTRASTTAEPPPGSPSVRPNLTPADLYGDGDKKGTKARIVIEEGSDSDSDIEDDIDLEEHADVSAADRFLFKSTPPAPPPKAAPAPAAPAPIVVVNDAGSGRNNSSPSSNSSSPSSSSEAAQEAPKKKKKKDGTKKKKTGKKAPKTSYEFMRKWRELDGAGRFEFLLAISPSAIGKLFKSNLDGEQLVGVLHTVRNFYFPDHAQAAFDLLKALSAVNRFDTVVMFLSSNEKADLGELFGLMDRAEIAEVQPLKRAYKVE